MWYADIQGVKLLHCINTPGFIDIFHPHLPLERRKQRGKVASSVPATPPPPLFFKALNQAKQAAGAALNITERIVMLAVAHNNIGPKKT